MEKEGKLVSVIIPAYNVEQYIARCVSSLLKQTYTNIEIVIVDDGSTDGTTEVCKELCKQNDRIIYLRKKNEGQGSARNLGIKLAKGKYVTFADADDWCAPEYIEKMYCSMEKFHTDICVCNKYGIELDENGKITHKKVIEQWMQPEEILNVIDNKNLIYQIKFSLWAKMFRREIFEKNSIEQPNHKFENNTIIPMLVSKAKTISMVAEPLYYYWMNRRGSTINTVEAYKDMLKCLNAVEEYFKREKYWDEYEEALYFFFKWNVIHTMNRIGLMKNNNNNEKLYLDIKKKLQNFMRTRFPNRINWLEKQVTIWGSYNLKKTVQNIVGNEQIKAVFSYSNIPSIMDKGCGNVKRKKHPNAYRENMIYKDITKEFCLNEEILKNTDFLFVDLLEERFPTCKMNGVMYTKSDILEETVEENLEEIVREQQYWELWEESCKKFIKMALKYLENQHIVLVKYRLSHCFGAVNQKDIFEEKNEIYEINKWLEKAYKFFEDNCKGCTVIEVQKDKFYFTDKEYEYGCFPFYLNYMVYDQVAQQIEKEMEVI